MVVPLIILDAVSGRATTPTMMSCRIEIRCRPMLISLNLISLRFELEENVKSPELVKSVALASTSPAIDKDELPPLKGPVKLNIE